MPDTTAPSPHPVGGRAEHLGRRVRRLVGLALAAVAGFAVTAALLQGGAATPMPDPEYAAHADRTELAPDVEVRDGRIVVDTPQGTRVLPGPDDDEVVAVQARPGDDPARRTLAFVARVDDGFGARDEVGYQHLDVVEGRLAPGPAFRLPARLQLSPEARAIDATVPEVRWSPDGDALAWIEWDAQGTWLVTLGWVDDADRRNPSEDRRRSRLLEVPPGTVLDAWTRDDGEVFLARAGEQPYRIELPASG
ncbi:MAG: hypothetical protein JJT89_16815 [Nitriliruptoraceae bacterium]|nr:hypothetical protein [Nitriliruptoraceae bacterium]